MTTASPPLARLLDQTAEAVAAVRAGRSLTDALARCPAELRPGTQALAFHVMRCWGGAAGVLALMAPKPPAPPVQALLVSALALMWPGSDPPYAEHTLVDQAVSAARQRTPVAANFINAVLRRFLRERDALVAAACRQPEAAYQHPAWWIERVRHDWPLQWQAVLHEANRHPPMVLRVNARRCSALAYVQRLAAAGRAASVIGPQAVWLAKPSGVGELPGFAEGDVSVQDLSAQRAAGLLLGNAALLEDAALLPLQFESAGLLPVQTATVGLLPVHSPSAGLPAGARVLDACAAPGGKTAHLLELAELDVLALDSDAQRLLRVQQTLSRLHLRATLQAADARDTARWWDGRYFDAILLDAPCTASGIVRRHPDVRWLRRPDDVAASARVQATLLDALWPLLKPGGRLLYAVCSIFRQEGEQQIDAFLQRQAGDKPLLDAASPGHLTGLPENGLGTVASAAMTGPSAAVSAANAREPWAAPSPSADGFYYALIHKP